jgi:hypothetical protein
VSLLHSLCLLIFTIAPLRSANDSPGTLNSLTAVIAALRLLCSLTLTGVSLISTFGLDYSLVSVSSFCLVSVSFWLLVSVQFGFWLSVFHSFCLVTPRPTDSDKKSFLLILHWRASMMIQNVSVGWFILIVNGSDSHSVWLVSDQFGSDCQWFIHSDYIPFPSFPVTVWFSLVSGSLVSVWFTIAPLRSAKIWPGTLNGLTAVIASLRSLVHYASLRSQGSLFASLTGVLYYGCRAKALQLIKCNRMINELEEIERLNDQIDYRLDLTVSLIYRLDLTVSLIYDSTWRSRWYIDSAYGLTINV